MSSVSAPENVTAPANVTVLRRPITLKSISKPETNRLSLKWWGEGIVFVNIKIVIRESHHLVVVRGAWQEASDFTAIVGKT